MFKKFKNQKGGQMVEYALLAALVAVAGIGSVRTLSNAVRTGPINNVKCALTPGGGNNGQDGTNVRLDDNCNVMQQQSGTDDPP